MYDSGRGNINKLVIKNRPFYSNSPPAHMLAQNKNSFYSPVHFANLSNKANNKAKVNFTYI